MSQLVSEQEPFVYEDFDLYAKYPEEDCLDLPVMQFGK
jgi:hypothetical protein